MDWKPSRIVSLQPSTTVTLRELGVLQLVVGCTKYCRDLCPEAAGLPTVHDSWTAQAEQIAHLRPDLVIASVPYQEKAIGEIMKAGARFLGLAPKSLSDIYADIAMIAGIVDAREQGIRVIENMCLAIDRIREQTSNLPRLRVFCEEWGKPLIASQVWVAELVEAAGGEFVAKPGVQISFDEAAALEPEVIIAAWCGARDRVPLERIIRTRKWENVAAAKNKRVYCIPDEYLNTPAPTLVCGLHALAAAIHPDQFPPAAGLRRMNH